MVKGSGNVAVVWGFGSTGKEVGILSRHQTRKEAEEALKKAGEESPDIALWIRHVDDDPIGHWRSRPPR